VRERFYDARQPACCCCAATVNDSGSSSSHAELLCVTVVVDVCTLSSGKRVRKPGPHLIVVPSSVLSNWQKELTKFCPALQVAVYHGSQVCVCALAQSITTMCTLLDSGCCVLRYCVDYAACCDAMLYMRCNSLL
jgi:SNF2-related domain